MIDKRKPVLEKIGCSFSEHDRCGFQFFYYETKIKDGDNFIYNKGILWKLKNPEPKKEASK